MTVAPANGALLNRTVPAAVLYWAGAFVLEGPLLPLPPPPQADRMPVIERTDNSLSDFIALSPARARNRADCLQPDSAECLTRLWPLGNKNLKVTALSVP